MLLKSIKLINFRQFIGENFLQFSIDKTRNVSIILGENGSGKTSMCQAFTWCLYGLTDFSDNIMLNKKVSSKMMPGESDEVRVEIRLIHNDTEFNISRKQNFKKRNNGNLQISPPVFAIAKKIEGQQEFINNPEIEMKNILPSELASYFFLNGEHIDKLNKELKKGKSQEFSRAVENLLGLKAFLEAIEHFNPRKTRSVLGKYNSQYDGNNNNEIKDLQDKIENSQAKLDKKEHRLNNISNEIEIGEESCRSHAENIRENEKSQEHQDRCDKLNAMINQKEKRIQEESIFIYKYFNNFGLSFLSTSIIKDSVNILAKEDIIDKGIPDIHERTIDFLLERGVCICGNELINGSDEYLNLVDTKEYIPPKSIGRVLSDYLEESGTRLHTGNDFFTTFSENFSHIRSLENDIDEHVSEIADLEKLLLTIKDVGIYQSKLSIEREKLDKLKEEEKELLVEKGAINRDIERFRKSLSELALQDSRNKKIEIYRSYSQEIFDKLTITYGNEETKVRNQLQKAINQLFKSIYKGGLSISIDEKYRITVTVDEVEGNSSEVETSTAQSTSIIFAFIAGIIKLAKKFSSDDTKENDLLASSEPYPLLMDAPLSNFDKRRIKTVCETLPKVAEQIIILIKDTDGDIAEKYLGNLIGARYEIIKENGSEIESSVNERK